MSKPIIDVLNQKKINVITEMEMGMVSIVSLQRRMIVDNGAVDV